MKVTIQSVHKINPSFKDVAGPYEAHASDFADIESARRWFKKHRISLGRVTWRKERTGWIFFPASRMSSSPHAYIVRPGSRLRLKGREIVEMSARLKQKGYSQPSLYARKLHREGIGLKGGWTEGGTAEGHRAEGGKSREGRRYVSGVQERLWSPRGGLGSLEQTHGFRDPAPRRKARSARE